MTPNEGRCPDELVETSTRVHVELRNGSRPAETWPAWGRGGLRWTLTGCPFDVIAWKAVD